MTPLGAQCWKDHQHPESAQESEHPPGRMLLFFYGSVGVRMWSWSWVLPPIPPRLLPTSEQVKTHCSSSDLKLPGYTFHQGKGKREKLLLHDRLAFMSQSEHWGIPVQEVEMATRRQTERKAENELKTREAREMNSAQPVLMQGPPISRND